MNAFENFLSICITFAPIAPVAFFFLNVSKCINTYDHKKYDIPSIAILALLCCALYGLVVGFCNGWLKHNKWRKTRKEVTLFEGFDDSLNLFNDTGHWFVFICLYSFGNAFIGLTFPISVPLMILFSKEKKKLKEKNK